MLDIKSLVPEVQKLLPKVSTPEILDGIKQFIAAHPQATNQDALTALTMYLKSQEPQPEPTPPFSSLVNSLGAK